MAYNQQIDGGYTPSNQPLPGAGAAYTENAYETGRPTEGIMHTTGLGHNQPMAGFGGAGKPHGYDTANVGIAPIGTGLIHDLTSPDVNVRHQAIDALAAGHLHHTATTTTTTGMGTNYGTGTNHTTGFNRTDNAVTAPFPVGTHDTTPVVHHTALPNDALFNTGAQPMHGTHKTGIAGMVETVKEKVTGGHHTQTGMVDNTGNAYGAHTGTPITSSGYRPDNALTAPFPAGTHDTTSVVHHGALPNDAPFNAGAQPMHVPKTGISGMVETDKNKVTGNTNTAGSTAYGAHTGTPITSGGYRTEPVGTGITEGNTPNTTFTDPMVHHDAHKKTGITGLVDKVTGGHHAPAHTTLDSHGNLLTSDRIPPPVGTKDTYGAMGVTTGATHHLRADNVSPVEVGNMNGVHLEQEKPGGIKGLINKVTGH